MWLPLLLSAVAVVAVAVVAVVVAVVDIVVLVICRLSKLTVAVSQSMPQKYYFKGVLAIGSSHQEFL